MDLAHLRYVHGYGSVDRVGTMSVDGVYLRSCFDFKRTQTIAGIASFAYDVSAVTHVYGLGYSFVEVHERFFDMETRLWVLATPVDGTLIEMVLVGQVRKSAHRNDSSSVCDSFLRALRTTIMRKITMAAQKRDVLQDVVIWEPEAVSTPSPSEWLRRRNREVSALLRTVLSRPPG